MLSYKVPIMTIIFYSVCNNIEDEKVKNYIEKHVNEMNYLSILSRLKRVRFGPSLLDLF
jgi:hypothetical protein